MTKILLYLALACLATRIVTGADVNSLCGGADWIPYEDEKCVKLFETFALREDAEAVCHQHGSTLTAIVSASEQTLLTDLILNATDSVNVWIGAQRRPGSSSEFVWNDGSSVNRFTNWAVGHPTDNVGRNCVQMRSQLGRQLHDMEWVDIACTIPNWFICQKVQIWQPEYIQQAFIDLRREVRDSAESFTHQITDLTHQLEVTNMELRNIQENPIPIGFVYVQLPSQPEPEKLWPMVEWREISADYAGLFFRVEGGESAEFGSVQEGNSPQLTSVRGRIVTSSTRTSIVVSANNSASLTLSSGASTGFNHWGLSFTVSSTEVRPRNTATRLWIRI